MDWGINRIVFPFFDSLDFKGGYGFYLELI